MKEQYLVIQNRLYLTSFKEISNINVYRFYVYTFLKDLFTETRILLVMVIFTLAFTSQQQ